MRPVGVCEWVYKWRVACKRVRVRYHHQLCQIVFREFCICISIIRHLITFANSFYIFINPSTSNFLPTLLKPLQVQVMILDVQFSPWLDAGQRIKLGKLLFASNDRTKMKVDGQAGNNLSLAEFFTQLILELNLVFFWCKAAQKIKKLQTRLVHAN